MNAGSRLTRGPGAAAGLVLFLGTSPLPTVPITDGSLGDAEPFGDDTLRDPAHEGQATDQADLFRVFSPWRPSHDLLPGRPRAPI